MKQISMMALGVSAGCVMLAACTRGEDVVVTTPQIASYGQVTDGIAQTLCTREEQCGEVGPSEKFDTMGECMGETSEEVVRVIDVDECGEGVYRDQLEACMSRLAAIGCDDSVDTDDVEACRQKVLCQEI